jgi:hypothetical protein
MAAGGIPGRPSRAPARFRRGAAALSFDICRVQGNGIASARRRGTDAPVEGEVIDNAATGGVRGMTDEEEGASVQDLLAARKFAVQTRRLLAAALKDGERSVLSDSHRRKLAEIQSAIEAIDRAIVDERQIVKKKTVGAAQPSKAAKARE